MTSSPLAGSDPWPPRPKCNYSVYLEPRPFNNWVVFHRHLLNYTAVCPCLPVWGGARGRKLMYMHLNARIPVKMCGKLHNNDKCLCVCFIASAKGYTGSRGNKFVSYQTLIPIKCTGRGSWPSVDPHWITEACMQYPLNIHTNTHRYYCRVQATALLWFFFQYKWQELAIKTKRRRKANEKMWINVVKQLRSVVCVICVIDLKHKCILNYFTLQ